MDWVNMVSAPPLKCVTGAQKIGIQTPPVRGSHRTVHKSVACASATDDILAEWIEDSYQLALASLTRAQRSALAPGGSS